MDDNAEDGIARVQLSRNKDLGRRQAWNIAYLDERIVFYLLALAFLGLVAVWLTASSVLLLYGSLVAAVLLVFLWGMARVGRINRIKQERARQVEAMKSDPPD